MASPDRSTRGVDLWFRSTVCLRRVDGAWRVAHEHTSTPVHMDGDFSAALDLRP
ncbi:nuclear transport factor 2 family protein [Saccharothrix texasensis]|uniref:nuclear transport factor 2 family protein n=1 Tax=Saccharothrix texasensis TaxID=103734 RepID=UPI001B872314|nr:nuclear transport factor 2 family protein [Saccharothrix texasensis]